MKAFVINLEKDTDRIRFMTDRLNALDVEFERIEAISAEDMTPDMMEYLRGPRADGVTVRWKNSEAACLFSHGKAWARIAGGEDAYGLILEDDVHLSGDLKLFTGNSDWVPTAAQIVRIETSTNRVLTGKAIKTNGRRVARLLSTAWCAGGYILSKEAARFLIDLEQPLYDHVDAYLFSHERSALARELWTYQVLPALAVQDKFLNKTPMFESNIEIDSDQASKPSVNLASGVLKTIQGYRRIVFQE